MNRFAKRLATAGLLVMVACSGGGTTTNNAAYELNFTGTLQGVVADAVTGKRIGGDLKLYLIQGATIRGPSRLITSSADPLAGEYAFTGVPVDFNGANARWKVVAVATGYQRFESEFTFTSSSTVGTGGSGIIDTVYNKLGNIFMFPTGTVAPDYNFTVYYNGKPVPNATVELDPLPGDNSAKFSTTTATNDTLFAFTGYVQSVTATTSATGVATVTGANLVLGGNYAVSVLPLVFTDTGGSKVPLALTAGNGIVVGFGSSGSANNDVNQIINMSDSVTDNGTAGIPLYIVTESNPPPNGQLFADGKLTLTFNAAVALVNPNCFDAVLVPGAKSDLTAAGSGVLSTTQSVNATLSADGLTLTLAPNYSTAPAATDRGVQITYSDGPPGGSTTCGGQSALIVPKDYPALSFKLFSIKTQNVGTTAGTTDSGVVHITGP